MGKVMHSLPPLLAAISCLLLAALAVSRPPRPRPQIAFACGMLVLALEALAVWFLVGAAGHGATAVWFRVSYGLALIVPVPWVLFVMTLDRTHASASAIPGRRLVMIASVGATAAVAFTILLPPYTEVAAIHGGVGAAAELSASGGYGIIVQILATIAVLAGLETCLRLAKRDARWQIKYVVLGLGGTFAVRFYLLSHLLLFDAARSVYLLTQTATLFLGNAVVSISLLRHGLFGVDLMVSRQMLRRSIVAGIAGGYLLVVGALGWFLKRIDLPETLFWGAVAAFVTALGLAAILLSDDVRWRVTRFLERHFYRNKYDYRDQWMSFTKRLGSLLTRIELAPQLVAAVTDATGARTGALYLVDDRDEHLYLAAAVGPNDFPRTLPSRPLRLAADVSPQAPIILAEHDEAPWGSSHGTERSTPFPHVEVVMPLSWQAHLVGVMLVGRERTGAPYTAEDVEFLSTVSEQAASTIMATRLSERLARAREFEAFHRLTSFVIHDVKNAVTALSMLSRSALENFDDREFQRDAIVTLSRTVDRMNALLGRLSSAPDVQRATFVELDLGALAAGTAERLVSGQHVVLVRDLRPIPRVRGDVEALERVLQNLIINALDAMEGEGQLTVRTRALNGTVACSIGDTGSGMPADFIRGSLFVPFRSTKPAGWGIGLYHAREIVHAHDGRLDVESVEGKGTTFTVTLPVAPGGGPDAGA